MPFRPTTVLHSHSENLLVSTMCYLYGIEIFITIQRDMLSFPFFRWEDEGLNLGSWQIIRNIVQTLTCNPIEVTQKKKSILSGFQEESWENSRKSYISKHWWVCLCSVFFFPWKKADYGRLGIDLNPPIGEGR